MGPETAQMMHAATAPMKALGCPIQMAVVDAIFEKNLCMRP